MQIPDLVPYLEKYKNLDKALEELGDGDPKSLLVTFPIASYGGHAGNTAPASRTVQCRFDELSAFCPWTRMPDQGSIVIEYRPNMMLLELKSYKYYLMAFRDKHITQEHLAQKVWDDLHALLNPVTLMVSLDYMPRGGIHTVFRLE